MKHYIITIAITLLMSLHIMAAGKSDEAQASSKINHFTWGADIGSTIDISGNDMSTIDIDAFFGYKNKFIRTVGLGAGIKSAIGNSYTSIPVYAILRTNFSNTPSLCFLDLRAGYAFNTLTDDVTQDSFFGAVGVGFNLYSTQEFKSHIILAYTFMNMDSFYAGGIYNDINNFSGMSVRIGINF